MILHNRTIAGTLTSRGMRTRHSHIYNIIHWYKPYGARIPLHRLQIVVATMTTEEGSYLPIHLRLPFLAYRIIHI